MNELSLETGARDKSAAKLRVVRRGAMVNFVLDRPRVLNAFDDEMCSTLLAEIPKIARNPDIYICAFTSTSPKAFCAGGDVRALVAAARMDISAARSYFAREYRLNWLLECFSKPTLSLIDGLCMGSGAGLSCYNTHRVAGENYAFAMPETAIGLFPDVGVGYILAGLPWPMGLYLGLTGRTVGRADAYWLGLATHCVGARHFEGVLSALADVEPVDAILDGLHEEPSAGPLQSEFGAIEEHFSAPSLAQIMGSLSQAKGASADWAAATLAGLRKRSPMSLAITDRHLRNCRSADLRATLEADYRLALRCLDDHDFAEGVRALLVDKDNAPRWRPSRLEDVTPEMVDRYFAPLPDGELGLPTREKMQAARV